MHRPAATREAPDPVEHTTFRPKCNAATRRPCAPISECNDVTRGATASRNVVCRLLPGRRAMKSKYKTYQNLNLDAVPATGSVLWALRPPNLHIPLGV